MTLQSNTQITPETVGMLKACPFCGGEAELIDRMGTAISCKNDQCIAFTHLPAPYNDYGHRESAIAAWNTRAALSTAEKRAAALSELAALDGETMDRPAASSPSAVGVGERLNAVANLIERPPVDDVLLDRSVAVKLAEDIRFVIATCDSSDQHNGVALSASDRACYDYPGIDQAPLRGAFVAGAVAYATPTATPTPSAVEGLFSVADAMVGDLMSMSDEELIKEAKEDGVDVDALVQSVRQSIACNNPFTPTPAPSAGDATEKVDWERVGPKLVEAGLALVASKQGTFGRGKSLEIDGEKAWIVRPDEMADLEAALAAATPGEK